MRTRGNNDFTTVRVEGAMLPADILKRVADGDAALGGLDENSYHLTSGEKVNEAVSASWNRLLGSWANYKGAVAKLTNGGPATTETRERWLLPLFQELDYGRLIASRKAVEIQGKSYPISHFWNNVPIHLVGSGVSLDKAQAGVPGAARTSPYGLIQEFLNRSEGFLWGFISNGRRFRILRDNSDLVRHAFVEFDLESMMEGEVYSDFVLLWLLCHQSRVESEKPTDFWLEKWSHVAQEQGVRALDDLRKGVEDAITALGRGFLAHPANGALREKLRSGALEKLDYYRQLLRLAYRLIFLFVTEDRHLLLDPAASEKEKQRYTKFYSTAKLRQLAARRHGTRHGDLYMALKLVTDKIGCDDGCPELALPALGSFLFSPEAMPDIEDCVLANRDLLEAVRALAFITDKGVRRQVDYKNLDSREIGSIYESLLELHPDLDISAPAFSLSTVVGNERKTSGSYYTPSSLINSLLDSALEPVLDEACGKPDPEAALLALKICDPACGSGHFLVDSGHRLAKRLAGARTGDVEPSPEAVRNALRDVVGRCLYGVDVNPMSVELCKFMLWMEALDPGKPLSFLDHHIQVGNSLFGTTFALLDQGLPDEAFTPTEGDDRAFCAELRRKNREERETGQQALFDAEGNPYVLLGSQATSLVDRLHADDGTVAGRRTREKAWEAYIRSGSYYANRFIADAWCAAFVWKMSSDVTPHPLTEHDLRMIQRLGCAFPNEAVKAEVARLKNQHKFFHFYLEFPDVFNYPGEHGVAENSRTGWSGGFDVVLGNPPWDQVQFREQEFFAPVRPDIAHASTGDARKRIIQRLRSEDPALYVAWSDAKHAADRTRLFIQASGLYPLTGRGRINTYALFAEAMRGILDTTGRVGCIVPSGIATDDSTKLFFQELSSSSTLVSLYDIENRDKLFPSVDSRYKFCLLTFSGLERPVEEGAEFIFFAQSVDDLKDEERRFKLSVEEINLLNPNTRTCPVFRSKHDAELTKAIYRRVPVLIRDGAKDGNPWGISTKPGLFNMTGSSGLFRSKVQLEQEGWRLDGNIFYRGQERYLPLYEGKMFDFYDHRAAHVVISATATLRQGQPEDLTLEEHQSPSVLPQPRHWVPEVEVNKQLAGQWNREWLLGWKEVTSSTNERTLIPGIFPRVGIGHKIPIALPSPANEALAPFLVACLSSFVCDYAARQKLGGVSLTPFTFKQLPVLPPSTYGEPCLWADQRLAEWLLPRVLELVYTSWDLAPFSTDFGYGGPPFLWNEDRRFLLRSELDAAFFHLYGVSRDDVGHVMDTFPIVRRKDEQQYAEYRTKRVILEMYSEMALASSTRRTFSTRLTPAPADASLTHPPQIQRASLVLPPGARYPQPGEGLYEMRVILSMLQVHGGSLDVRSLMAGCGLLATPDMLEGYAAATEGDIAHEWRRRYCDTFNPEAFLPTLDNLVRRGEIKLVRQGDGFVVSRVENSDLVTDPYIELDARLALRVAASLSPAEQGEIVPLATKQQIEARSRVA